MLIKSILSGNNSYRQMFIRWSITKGQTHFFFKWKKEESLNLFLKSHSYFLVVFYRDIINYRTIMLYVITSKLSKCKQLSPSKEHTYVAQICSKNKFNLAHGAVIHNIPEVCAYICTVSSYQKDLPRCSHMLTKARSMCKVFFDYQIKIIN